MFNNKETIINGLTQFAKDYQIPLDQIAIGGGAALVLMGVRKETADLNIWVDDEHYLALADKYKVIVRAWHDTVVNPEGTLVWVRRRNHYFKTVDLYGLKVFDVISLVVQKRGSLLDHLRNKEKQIQDRKDIYELNELMSVVNKVV